MARPLLPAEAAGGPTFHFTVIRDPTINAFALANGGVIVHTGLLAAVQNEAQLALVLGHEIAHTNQRHQLNGLRDFQRKTVFAKVATTTLGPAAAAFTGGLGLAAIELMVGATYVATVNGYSRSEEEAADLAGMRAMAAAGYATEQGPTLFSALNEVEEPGAVAIFFYGNHPANAQREHYTRALIDDGAVPRNPEGRVGVAELRAATERAVQENIRLRLHARHYDYARRELERAFAYYGESAQLRYLEGETHRLIAQDPEGAARESAMRAREDYDPAAAEERRVGSPGEFDAAVKAYERALEVDPKLHAAQRGLGEIAWQRGDASGAAALLDRYLIDVPNAPDSLYVKKLLKRIRETPKRVRHDPRSLAPTDSAGARMPGARDRLYDEHAQGAQLRGADARRAQGRSHAS